MSDHEEIAKLKVQVEKLKRDLEEKRESHKNIAVLAECLSQRHPGIPGEDIYLLAARLLDEYAAEIEMLKSHPAE